MAAILPRVPPNTDISNDVAKTLAGRFWRSYSGTAYSPSYKNDVIMSAMASQSPASRLFTQPFIQAEIKENIKGPRHWPLWGGGGGGGGGRGVHRWPVNPPTKGQ